MLVARTVSGAADPARGRRTAFASGRGPPARPRSRGRSPRARRGPAVVVSRPAAAAASAGAPEAAARALRQRGLQAVGAGCERLRVRIVKDDLVARRGSRAARSRRPSSRRRRPRAARRSTLYLPWNSGLRLSRNALHALDPVLGGHRQLIQAALLVEAGAPGRTRRRPARPAWRAWPPAAVRRRRRGRGRSPRSARPALSILLTMPHSSASLGVEAPAGQDQLHRALLAQDAREALRPAAAGDDPERDLGLAELGAVSEATIMSQASASSQPPPSAKPGDARRSAASGSRRRASRRWTWGGTGPRRRSGREGRGCRRLPRTPRRMPAITIARTLVVVVEPLERRAQLVHHLRRQRVAGVGPVEPKHRDCAVALLDRRSRRLRA